MIANITEKSLSVLMNNNQKDKQENEQKDDTDDQVKQYQQTTKEVFVSIGYGFV
jgi:hypothetical protein